MAGDYFICAGKEKREGDMGCVRRVQVAHYRGHREQREKRKKRGIHRTKACDGAEILNDK
jgi:hypothetical protein